jgi:kynurenine formamidase
MAWFPSLIDLTRPLTNEAVIALAGKFAEPGSPYSGIELSYLRNWDSENGMVCKWTLNDHLGTHLDAPIHVVPGAPTVDQVDINRLVGEAVVIDCAFANGRGRVMTSNRPSPRSRQAISCSFTLPSGRRREWRITLGNRPT